jgi:hypothetical protein
MTQELRVRNYSERTVRSYITSIYQLSVFYKTSPDKITKDQEKNYACYLIHSKDALIELWIMKLKLGFMTSYNL